MNHPRIPRRVYQKDLAPTLGYLALDQISPRDIRATINLITNSDRPSIANDALIYCKQLFRHGIKLDLLRHNPAESFTFDDAGGVEKVETALYLLTRSKESSLFSLKTRSNSAERII